MYARRIGIKEGIPHRGVEQCYFVEEGIGLAEVDLIPEGNLLEERECDKSDGPSGEFTSDDCRSAC